MWPVGQFAKSKPLGAFESFEYLQEVASPEHSMGVQQVRIEVRLPEGHWAGHVREKGLDKGKWMVDDGAGHHCRYTVYKH